MRVLIADDRPSLRAAVRALLEHDPECAGIDEAETAVDVLAALQFGADVVILGWNLRGMPSETLVRRVRELRSDLIIVALGRFDDTRQVALDAGADYYIDTSQPPADFITILHQLCPQIKTTVARGGAAKG